MEMGTATIIINIFPLVDRSVKNKIRLPNNL